MLKQRIITAAILVPVVLAILYFSSPPVFCLLSAAFFALAAAEWTTLIPFTVLWQRIAYVAAILVAGFGVMFVPTPLIFSLTFFWWLSALILVLVYPRGATIWGESRFIKAVMGGLVLIPCWAAINYLRNETNGIYVLLFVLVLIWGADTSAYFAGKKWGTIKLAPAVSPGKTIQGALGALAYAVVLTLVAALFAQPPVIVILGAIMLAVVTVLFSILGDLFESMLKRQVGLKDSGNIFPGHGGILDRIDSLTAAAPIYALGSLLLSIFFS